MRTPTCRSSPFTCSSCWPSSSRKRRASAKRSSAGAGAVSAKRLPAPGAEQLVGAGELPLQRGDPLLELALLGEELLEPGRGFLARGAQERADVAQHRLVAADQLERALAGDGLQPPHPGGDPALAADLEHADVAGA